MRYALLAREKFASFVEDCFIFELQGAQSRFRYGEKCVKVLFAERAGKSDGSLEFCSGSMRIRAALRLSMDGRNFRERKRRCQSYGRTALVCRIFLHFPYIKREPVYILGLLCCKQAKGGGNNSNGVESAVRMNNRALEIFPDICRARA